jgi:hypothetical protein
MHGLPDPECIIELLLQTLLECPFVKKSAGVLYTFLDLRDGFVNKFKCTFSVTALVSFGDLEFMPRLAEGRQSSLHMRLVRAGGSASSQEERADDQRNHYSIAN